METPQTLSDFPSGALRSNCKIIDGKAVSQDILKNLRIEIEEWVKKSGRAPCLVAILVGEDPASEKYVENKMIAAKNVGTPTLKYYMYELEIQAKRYAL
ncbi:hypothetical protein NQ315_005991 [Exocentrus adspersus]|uniref:Tetrahydrofolate dehydrogenase/cyclohydrolase catalytic domain-containing protein n=1 Tax=Exocentrus adspersus TaxID=1586481 RepID=A0AAV8VC61_9CUCU|nr:hypothetical protein NQ315_005991 [Exocentrus adspersus]